MRVLGLIPARGGSKGVPGKNIRPLAGRPLLEYTAESALKALSLDRVVLTTDDEEIAEVGKRCGLDVPFLRPSDLAQDKSPTLPVVVHALKMLSEAGEEYEAVCLLQPTNPFRKASDIDSSVALLERSGADSVISVLRVPHEYNPEWVYKRLEDGSVGLFSGRNEPITRRQDLPEAFHRDGTIYVTRSEVITASGSLYGSRTMAYEIDPGSSVNIDTEEDWLQAEEKMMGSAAAV